MAVAGALIVFSGLIVLTTAISQIHRILLFLETKYISFRNNNQILENEEPEEQPESVLPTIFPTELDELASLYQPLFEEIGDTFFLSDLYKIAKENHFPHPHITFTAFRNAKILIPHGDGVFSWEPPQDNSANKNE